LRDGEKKHTHVKFWCQKKQTKTMQLR
jgi:hypothetical protein